MVNNTCVMHNVSAADINTMMQISKPRCAKMCTEWRIHFIDREPFSR